MCGRYSIYDIEEFAERFGVKALLDFKPVYNAAPAMNLPIITNDKPDVVTLARWGLVPHWAKDVKIGYKMINARAETIAERSAYKKPFESQRCLVPVNGFYEWKHDGSKKIPYNIRTADKGLFSLAGIWDRWVDQDEKVVISYSIITTDACPDMKKIHDRMPVILPQSKEKEWLETGGKKLLKSYCSGLDIYQVSQDVNSPKNNTEDVLKRLTTLDSF